MRALIIIGLIAILGGCGRSDMLDLQELDEMWAEEHGEEE